MHLRNRNLPRPSASSPPGNRSHPMANPAQAPDLEGLHREIHDMAEQMRIMNENNGRLMQLLAAANPPLPAAPLVPEVERSRHSNRSGNRSRNISADPVGRGRRQAPSSSLREKSSSESSKTPTRSRRGRSPRRDDHVRTRDKSTSQKIRDLDARLDAINAGVGAPVTVDTLIKQTEPPFTERILRARISSKFKLPAQLGIYEGKTDPMDHLDSYKSLMSLQEIAKKNASHLFTIHQKENESLKEFVKRFNQAILEVEDPSDKVIIMAMMEGLRPGPLFDSLSKNVPETLSALQSKADKYIAAEELSEAKRRRRGKDDHKRKEPDTRRADYREETRYKRPDRDPKRSNNRRPRTPPRRPEFILPPLNAPVAQVLSEIKHEEFVKWPGKIKTDPQKRNRNKYCEFHRDHGHNTEDCFQLKEQIADLIKRGYLRKYITDRPPPNSPERRYGDNRPTAGNIQTIHGGFGSGGCSTSSRKKHARSALRSVEEEVYNLSSPCVGDQPPITFGSDDLRGLHLPHDDALVISAVIANFNVQRILIDNGTEPHQTTVWQDFIVVDCPSPYNAILGRPTLGEIKAITSTYHLKMKFPTLTGIGEVKGDQKVARQCFISSMKLILEDPREIENTKPLEEVVPISIHPNFPDRQVMIGTKLTDELRVALIDFLKKNSDVFAWSQGDVPGIDPQVAMHKLFTKPEYSPVRQKRRKFAPERLKVIEDEILPQPETTPLEEEIPNEPAENLAHWILFVDGSSNQHGCGAGLVIRAPSGEQMEYAIRMGFKATNNEAEYEALLAGLRVATELGAQSLEVFSDSQLVVNQVQGDYLAKDARMIAYLGEVKAVSAKIKEFKIHQIPREDNKKADALANLASTFEFISDRCIPLEFLTSPSIGIANQVLQTEENPTWLDEIIAYLQEGILPRDKLQARRLQYRSARFCIFKGRLYKRSFSGPLLRCLRLEEAKFGVPKVIISDNARQFDNDRFRLFCSDLAISHHFSSPGHPQANGQVEVTNRTILRNLKARLERSKSEWAENLPSILWAYHTTSRIPTGETPYSMVFGTESVIPVEIGMPSFRVSTFNKETNEAELRLNLDLLEERRESAELRQTAYKCQVAKYYNQRVRHRSFLPGDLVLRKVTLSTKEPNAGKLGPTWEGPYKVIKVSRPGTYWLEDLDGKALSHPWNAEHLKKYYQ
ncbi:hypothetical protein Acr_10g0008110 [Actinidia rufa]|uniref:Uncharacterized protein n=1 Tax=Actinidia rufa TaxID=165716 RepID=A0A7J0FAH5_9ERIC|nr:hypothetical protein Acr_10g0008110 [Actinidia rufa]